MAQTVQDIPRHLWQMYQPAAVIKERQQNTAVFDAQHRQKGWLLAQTAARLLYDQFEAKQVIVFGSLASETLFNRWSDIDLAVWGIPPEQFYTAVAAVTSLSTEIKIDLVDPADCQPSLQAAIVQNGVTL